jgi:hypothetical protein
MRFLYNKRLACVLSNGELQFNEDSPKTFNQAKLDENYNLFRLNTYQELLKEIENESKNKIEKSFVVMMDADTFLIAVSAKNNTFKTIGLYTPENVELLNFMKKMFSLDNGDGRIIFANVHNNFNFMTAKSILRVIFTAAYLKGQGEPLYHEFKIKSKNGKIRNITAPHETLKKELRALNTVFQHIFDKINSEFQVAYKKDKSIVDNAAIHKDNKFVYNVDLKDFYPSCKREYVQKHVNFFFKNSFNGDVLKDEFLEVILRDDALFIGSPISGTLANLIISKPVKYIKNITANFGMEFSVYADDMTFSSDRFISRKVVENIFNLAFIRYNMEEDFILNENKFHGMSNNRRRITGVSINHNDQPTVSRKYYRDLRVKIHKLSLGETKGININKLRGKIAFALMVDGSDKIYNLIKKFETTIKTYKLVGDQKLKDLKTEKGDI